MKNKMIFLLIIMCMVGCGLSSTENKIVLAKINNYEITLDEFQEQFKESSYSRDGSPEAKKEFLKVLISHKLILQDAERKGLDKKKEFLKMIERFWEQSLLKLALQEKSQEIASFAKMKEDKQAQDRLMRDWMSGLEKEAKISVNYDLLK